MLEKDKKIKELSDDELESAAGGFVSTWTNDETGLKGYLVHEDGTGDILAITNDIEEANAIDKEINKKG